MKQYGKNKPSTMGRQHSTLTLKKSEMRWKSWERKKRVTQKRIHLFLEKRGKGKCLRMRK